MRIDAMNKVSQIYQANSTKKTGKTSSVSSNTDRLEISQAGKDFQIAKQAVALTADVRQEKVDALKQQMASGNYNVNDDDLAEKLLGDYFGTI